jgi:hypothetical protein
MTPHKKQLPLSVKSPTDGRLDVIHCNSAFTYACRDESPTNTIFVFRHEEWFKVLMHETMHCLGLDFSTQSSNPMDAVNRRIRELFPGAEKVSDYKITELYAEIWADILNIGFTNQSSMTNVWEQLSDEQAFSRLQAKKILDYYNTSYDGLLGSPRGKMAEPTPAEYLDEKVAVFSYYLCRALVLSEMDSFLRFCESNNRSQSIIKFCESNNRTQSIFSKTKPEPDSRMAFVEQVIVPGIKYYQLEKYPFTRITPTDPGLRMTCTRY